MMEDYGTKWSLSIQYNNAPKFFIIGVILISFLASKNTQPQMGGKKRKGKKKGKKKKNLIAQTSVSIWWPDSNTATSDFPKDRTQIKRYASYFKTERQETTFITIMYVSNYPSHSDGSTLRPQWKLYSYLGWYHAESCK